MGRRVDIHIYVSECTFIHMNMHSYIHMNTYLHAELTHMQIHIHKLSHTKNAHRHRHPHTDTQQQQQSAKTTAWVLLYNIAFLLIMAHIFILYKIKFPSRILEKKWTVYTRRRQKDNLFCLHIVSTDNSCFPLLYCFAINNMSSLRTVHGWANHSELYT